MEMIVVWLGLLPRVPDGTCWAKDVGSLLNEVREADWDAMDATNHDDPQKTWPTAVEGSRSRGFCGCEFGRLNQGSPETPDPEMTREETRCGRRPNPHSKPTPLLPRKRDEWRRATGTPQVERVSGGSSRIDRRSVGPEIASTAWIEWTPPRRSKDECHMPHYDWSGFLACGNFKQPRQIVVFQLVWITSCGSDNVRLSARGGRMVCCKEIYYKLQELSVKNNICRICQTEVSRTNQNIH